MILLFCWKFLIWILMLILIDWIVFDWFVYLCVKVFVMICLGGVSMGFYGLVGGLFGGLNFGQYVGDVLEVVEQNCCILCVVLLVELMWMEQVYGIGVVDFD